MFVTSVGRIRVLRAIGVACMVSVACRSGAMTANPNPIKDRQPDGTPIVLTFHGDEYFHWYEDAEGFTVVRSNGWYLYAQLDASGELAPTLFRVGRDNPKAAGIERKLLPAASFIEGKRTSYESAIASKAATIAPIAPSGTVKNIVILIRFSDHVARPLPTNPNFDVLFNAVGGDPTYAPTGSVADAYYENSYGTFTLDSDIYGWVDLPNTESYYAAGVSGLGGKVPEALVAALNAVDAQIDFSQYDSDNDSFVDSIAFVHSGYAAEFGGTDQYGTPSTSRIWSHRSGIAPWTSAEGVKVSAYHINPGVWGTSGSSIGRIGVICHETGHFFGLPDLYDTSKPGEGIGSWGMMANSWGFSGNQYNPPHFSAWSKIALGWVTPTVISTPGTYAVPQVETTPKVYKVTQGYPAGEYLLIENRQPAGLESTMPQGGLAIFHVDDTAPYSTQGYPGQTGWPQNGNHYRVALLQADGQYQLEQGGFGRGDSGDVYRAGFATELSPSTLPNTNAYQGGTIINTGNTISAISASSANMSFWFGGPPTDIVYVDFGHFGNQNGSIASPWNTLAEALSVVDPGGEIRIKGDTIDSDSSETMTINQAVTIKAVNGPVQIGVPALVGSGQYSSADVPVSIPDNATVSSDLVVAENYEVTDVNVTLNLSHTYDGDLLIELISPYLTTVTLVNHRGGSGQNFFGTTLDDEAGFSISVGAAPFGGSYRPDGSLASLDGQGSQGTWTLRITDDATFDTGTLNAWSITLNGG